MSLTVGSLFSGIGGLDLGLERAGMNVIWQSEIDPYGCRVLKKHWPEVPNHGNIKEINWRNVIRPDVLCGGYPCQPFSTAGKRNGTDDPRHLWPWVREAISELRPKYAILENVRGHVSLGLSTVLGEMASIGYDAEWQIVSAASVGAPHLRERVIILAYPNGGRQQECQSETKQTTGISCGCKQCTDTLGELAYADGIGSLHGRPKIYTAERWLNALGHTWAGGFDVANADSSPGEQQPKGQIQKPDVGRRSKNVANTDSSNPTDGRQREGLQSQDTSRGDDRSGSGSDTGQISMGSTGQNSGYVADTDNARDRTPNSGTNRDGTQEIERRNIEPQFRASRRSTNVADTDARETSRGLRGVSTDTRQVREQRDYARGEESHAGGQWWASEPDVGRVANGVSSRVDRLRGLGNAVVPQVAELIGRMVMDYDTHSK